MVDQLLSPESPHSNISTENPTSSGFDQTRVIRITIVSILCLFGICTNSLSLYKLTRKRLANKGFRMTLLLIHLSIADLIVILVQGLEAWQIREAWKADEVTCQIYCSFGPLGFYISGFVMMVISVDRWSAIIHPLTHNANPRATKIMLAMAWLLALVLSIPNSFRVHLTENKECTIDASSFFSNSFQMELLYDVYSWTLFFFLPLFTMLGCHIDMIVHLHKKSKIMLGQQGGDGVLLKAKVQTVKITSVLTLGFIVCWTPTIFLILWRWIDGESHPKAKIIWYYAMHFACVNNCLNPLFYGMVGNKCVEKCGSRNKFFGKSVQRDLTKKTTTTETSDTKSSVVLLSFSSTINE